MINTAVGHGYEVHSFSLICGNPLPSLRDRQSGEPRLVVIAHIGLLFDFNHLGWFKW